MNGIIDCVYTVCSADLGVFVAIISTVVITITKIALKDAPITAARTRDVFTIAARRWTLCIIDNKLHNYYYNIDHN